MQKVFARMMANQYHGIEDMVSDLVLMFDNACRYNEPESLIYKVGASVKQRNASTWLSLDASMRKEHRMMWWSVCCMFLIVYLPVFFLHLVLGCTDTAESLP